jgi:energy-coupling factor transport system ATP-binding protein
MEKYPIILENVTFTYEGSREPALKNINLNIRRGEITAILGRTGAGKTTTIYAMGGIIPNYIKGKLKGDVIIEGLNTKEHPLYEIAKYIGVVMDDPEAHIVSFTVWEDVAFGPSNLGLSKEDILKRVEFSLNVTRLEALRNRNPYNLSGGEKQSLAIAGMLSMRPNILALDEPTSMLDPLGSKRVLSVLKELNKKYAITLVLSDFNAERISDLANRIIVLDRGEVVADGDFRKIIQNVEMLEKLGIHIPEVTKLSSLLKNDGFWNGELAINVNEAFEKISKMIISKVKVKKKHTNMNANISFKPIISVRKLSHIYPNGVQALKEINLDIYEGEFVALIGQNGSGKTTLAKHLCGLLKPTNKDAKIIIDGLDITNAKIKEIVKKVGYVFQIPEQQLFSINVKEEIGFGLRNLGFPQEYIEKKVKEIIKILKLEDYSDYLITSLDRGKKFRVVLGSIMAIEPKIIIVDEPTTGQDWADSVYICTLLENLRKRGKTIIMITHEMGLVAKFATRIIAMYNGEILIDGSTREVFSKPEILRKTWVQPPQITMLSQSLSKYGIRADILSVEEMYDYLIHILKGDI